MTRASVDDAEEFRAFFSDATGFAPYEWQVDVATKRLPEVLPVPTGLGKTEGAALAWAWRQLAAKHEEPRHLVYCLPMRTLVRQTAERLTRCFAALASRRGLDLSVYQLMGGAIEDEWARWPEKPWVLVGTQDQLLSRALNRGYAMSRFEWPVHFGLLNQDCHWIMDEVQLMGPGLWTSAQLDWTRRRRFSCLKPCRPTWMSATVGAGFLATTDRKRDGLDTVVPFDPRLDKDGNKELQRRRAAKRPVKWFAPPMGKGSRPVHEQIAAAVCDDHVEGTLSLVVCNTVEMAQQVFRALPPSAPKILLTSRFRRQDREQHEQRLIELEAKRAKNAQRNGATSHLADDPGLICVSTQVVEAGLDISAGRLWSELASWPSVVQRLGRLNRDGRDPDARARFWRTPKIRDQKREDRIGPYEKADIERAASLLGALIVPSSQEPFSKAVEGLGQTHAALLDEALQPAAAPLPRALDVHGLFATERDVHGGFTDVSAFVRGAGPDADTSVLWRVWSGATPPRGDALDGPDLDVREEGCQVAFFRLRDFLEQRRARAWTWNDEDEQWEWVRPHELRPGMVVMLHRDAGGYDVRLGWTGTPSDVLGDVLPAGRGRALRGDEHAETGWWARLDVHLGDARREAERICDGLGLRDDDQHLRPYRVAIVEAAAMHDLGKAHPRWQDSLPAGAAVTGGPWAKCPRVLAVDADADAPMFHEAVTRVRPDAIALPSLPHRRHGVRLRWAVGKKLTRQELDQLSAVAGARWAGHVPFRPGMRHEAASALAMWQHYRQKSTAYPALAVYLAAAHHGKVRTVLRATTSRGEDVFGLTRELDALDVFGQRWPLDFSVAADGAAGEWREGHFVLIDHGWTGLVADLLGPWRSREEDGSDVGAVPENEPRQLGPFLLAWLEALVRVADWRASEQPSRTFMSGEVSLGG
ncbi:MAG: DEAD/DEAH box helicase [Deltaproteobacteria bacterium]|nr:DEAD/DEAH box helicase [Deltaproteobacteria bacterium]